MKRAMAGAAVLTGLAAGAIIVRQLRHRVATGRSDGRDRWHSVTINCEPEEVGSLPKPLANLGSTVEVRIRPAPDGRGTELAARLSGEPPASRDDVRRLRRALRDSRQLAEVGEVLLPDGPPTTRRTLLNRPLAYATRHAREEGRL